MTYGQLFREVWLQLHPCEDCEMVFKHADSVAPSMINEEVPPEHLEAMRQFCLMKGRQIDSQPDEVNDKELRKFLSNN